MRKGFLKKAAALGLAAGMVLSTAACGTSQPVAGTTEAASSGSASGNTVEADATTMVFATNQSFKTTDTMNDFTMTCKMLGLLWGDSLWQSDHEGSYTPWIATDWEWNDDYTQIVINLRDDVKFTDGNALTADDVAFTLNRIKENSDDISQAFKFGNMDKAEVTGDNQVTVTFTAPMPLFYEEVGNLPIIEKSAYEADPDNYYTTSPIGSGAYKVTSFDVVNSTAVLEKNPDWFGWSQDAYAGNNVEKISVITVGEDTTRVSSLRSGEIDVSNQIPLENVDQLEESGVNVETMIGTNNVYLGFQTKEGSIFADEKLREAFSLCIDRELLVDSILGGGEAATWPSKADTIGYSDADTYEYNLEEAQQLLTEAGYNGEEIDFLVDTSVISKGSEVVQAIQSMADEAGFNVKLDMVETATYDDRRSASNYDVFIGSFSSMDGDTYSELVEIMGGDLFKTNYSNDKLTELANEAAVTVDRDTRDQITKEAFQIVMDEFAPTCYLYNVGSTMATNQRVTGAKMYQDGVIDLRGCQLSE